MKIYIIGLGKVGRTLLNAYRTVENTMIYIYDRDKTKVTNEMDKKTVFPVFNINEIKDADTIFITVIDQKVLAVMGEISNEFEGNIVIMSATVSMAEAEKRHKHSKNLILMHPIQTFSDSKGNRESLNGIYFSVQFRGSKSFVDEFCDEFNCNYIIPDEKFNRYLYHLSCIFASNFIVIMMKIASELINESGLSNQNIEHVLYPMMQKTVDNITKKGISQSLTGPVMRGDIEVIKNHLNAIKDEELKDIYRLLIKRNIDYIKDMHIPGIDEMEKLIND